MLILRNNSQFTVVTKETDILFNKNSPNFGGKLSERLLDALEIPPFLTGKWAVQTINDSITSKQFVAINGLDLRKIADKLRVTLMLVELKNLVVKVEKI